MFFRWQTALALVVAIVATTGCATVHAAGLCNEAALKAGMRASYHQHDAKRVLVLAGRFNEGAAGRVSRAVANTKSYEEVWLCSWGGRVSEGMALGRSLARVNATVRVPNGFECVSSCTIAFLGGYVRIIEPQAQYVVHASSRFSKSAFIDGPSLINCSRPRGREVCQALEALVAGSPLACQRAAELEHEDSTCYFYGPFKDRARDTLVLVRYRLFVLAPELTQHVTLFADYVAATEAAQSVDLLGYYQEMLLAGSRLRRNASAYAQLKRSFQPVSVYDSRNTGDDARSLSDDARVFAEADFSGRRSLWQSILTDSELTAKRQLIAHIRAHDLRFGPAGADALRILEAMVVCQIQTSCRLSQQEAAVLGIHNVLDAN